MKAKQVVDLMLSGLPISRIRENIGNSNLTAVLEEVAAIFARRDVPYSIVGGYAVQHYGYVRTTQDLDLVVKELNFARTALLSSDKFKPVQGNEKRLIHKATGVEIDLLIAGSKGGPTALPYPNPVESTGIQFITLPGLISLKLSAGRYKDLGDVVELIKVNNLSRSFSAEVDPSMSAKFIKMWEAAQDESNASH
jgi:hypothetical protein